MESQMQAIGFKMATEEKARLEQIAQDQGRSLSGQIRFILSAYLKDEGSRTPQPQTHKNLPA